MRHVIVSAQHSDRWWILTWPEGDLRGRCKRLEQAPEKLRAAIAARLDLPPDSFVVDVDVELPDEYREWAKTAAERQDEAVSATRAAQTARREAAQVLAARELTVRDIGRLMGISHQSVHRLLKSDERVAENA